MTGPVVPTLQRNRLGVVLGIIALFRHGQRKVQAILAIVFGVAPSLAVFGIPAFIDTLF